MTSISDYNAGVFIYTTTTGPKDVSGIVYKYTLTN